MWMILKMFAGKLVSFLTYFLIFQATIETVNGKPCWCSSLSQKLRQSNKMLQERYQVNLDASTFLSSGSNNDLIKRIYNCLNNRIPFKMGLVGGSFAIPSIDDGNTWAANFTRWMNVMISSSVCDKRSEIPLVFKNYSCAGYTVEESEMCRNKTIMSTEGHEKPVFCQPFSHVTESATYHPSNRPLSEICDDAHHKRRRPCSVYIGSGKYATMTNAAKGNSQTTYSEKFINRILDVKENFDFVFWDHSMNDDDGCLMTFAFRFFEKLFRYHKSISGIGLVYWTDGWPEVYENITSCLTRTMDISNFMATYHYPYLEKYFDPFKGRYKNISVITMSQAYFCYKFGCNYFDFIDRYTAHPHSIGNSRFADLVIWQFLHIFKRVIKRYCDVGVPKNVSSRVWSIHHKDNTNSSVLYTANTEEVKEYKEALALPLESYPINLSVADIQLVAAMPLTTPVVGKPSSVQDLALLCAPGIPVLDANDKLSIAFENIEHNISIPLRWLPADISTLLQEKCAGWSDSSLRQHVRHDADHRFRPGINSSCTECPPPIWVGEEYPHGRWVEMPLVKKVDLVVRISTKLRWTHVCYLICTPRVLMRDAASGAWTEMKHAMVLESLRDGPWGSCHKFVKPQPSPATVTAAGDFYYLWYPADVCYRTRHGIIDKATNRTEMTFEWEVYVEQSISLIYVSALGLPRPE